MDPSGHLWDLKNIANATRLVDWTAAQVLPYVQGDVAELGAGIGTYTERLLGAGVRSLLVVEPEPECAAELRRRFGTNGLVRVAEEDLPAAPTLRAQAGGFDTIVNQNVIEHVDDDRAAVSAMASALRPGGILTIQVPAHPRLYGALDRVYGHHRRYTKRGLHRLLEDAGLEVLQIKPFNALGVVGWVLNRWRRAPRLSPGSLRMYELLLRVWRPIEDRLPVPWGLNWVAYARRPG